VENKIVQESNNKGILLFSESFPGAFTRAVDLDEALKKFEPEIQSYCKWARIPFDGKLDNAIIQTSTTNLAVEDADSEVIFHSELRPLQRGAYGRLKNLVLKSAEDFQSLYDSVPDKDETNLPDRETFYGKRPRTAREMYDHVCSVNKYYFAQLGIDINEYPDVLAGRLQGFWILENKGGFLLNKPIVGSDGEQWTLSKMLRRFLWHDRIHAKAMYRMASKIWPGKIINPFRFEIEYGSSS
jgi:hypothetical protein